MLTFAEEILLLLLDDDGNFISAPETTIDCAMTGAVLMDLAFAGRIDTDLDELRVMDKTPTGDPLQDRILERISAEPENYNTRDWIDMIRSDEAQDIREHTLTRLVERGILEYHEEKLLWVFRTRRYPMIDGKAEQEVRTRIIEVLQSDDIPDPRDIALICLVEACNLLPGIMPGKTDRHVRERVEDIRKMDLIGREVAGAVSVIEASIMMSVAQAPN